MKERRREKGREEEEERYGNYDFGMVIGLLDFCMDFYG